MLRNLTTASVVLLAVGMMLGGAMPAGAVPGLTGQWKFNGNLANSGSGPMKMTVVSDGGTGTFQTVDVNGTMKTAWVFTAREGLSVTKIPIASRTTYSIDVYFEFDDLTSYKRILSFGPNVKDRGLYLLNGMTSLYPVDNGATAVTPNTWHHVAITRSAAGAMRVYLDGSLEITHKDRKGKYLLGQGKVVFFEDETTGSENASGTVSLIRIYDHVISPL